MPVRPTIQVDNSLLRETAVAVQDVMDVHVQSAIADCIDTMHAESLAGYAAPQLGESLRIFVTELRETKYRKGIMPTPLTVYINPKITYRGEETELDWEGCGSIPDVFGQVERSKDIAVTYLDEKGSEQSLDAHGLLARVIQHEYDHLEGILFTDLINPESQVNRDYYLRTLKDA